MKPQAKVYSCGAAALRNALRARWGHKVAEGRVRSLAGTTPAGTDERGIQDAARALGYKVVEHWSDCRTASWDWLHGALRNGRPVILCLDAWQHWATAIGVLGNRVVVYDPARFKSNRAEDGIHVLDRSRLLHRLWNGRKSIGDKRRAYALALYK